MRRPLSIMRANATQGWLEFLYKPIGEGLAKLASHGKGESISLLGPIGNGFDLDPGKPNVLAIGGGVGMPPIIFLAERHRLDDCFRFLVRWPSSYLPTFPWTAYPVKHLLPPAVVSTP